MITFEEFNSLSEGMKIRNLLGLNKKFEPIPEEVPNIYGEDDWIDQEKIAKELAEEKIRRAKHLEEQEKRNARLAEEQAIINEKIKKLSIRYRKYLEPYLYIARYSQQRNIYYFDIISKDEDYKYRFNIKTNMDNIITIVQVVKKGGGLGLSNSAKIINVHDLEDAMRWISENYLNPYEDRVPKMRPTEKIVPKRFVGPKRFEGLKFRNFIGLNKKYEKLPIDHIDPYGEEDFDDDRKDRVATEERIRLNQILQQELERVKPIILKYFPDAEIVNYQFSRGARYYINRIIDNKRSTYMVDHIEDKYYLYSTLEYDTWDEVCKHLLKLEEAKLKSKPKKKKRKNPYYTSKKRTTTHFEEDEDWGEE